jgi:exodeoxyribonuclease VII small subunit
MPRSKSSDKPSGEPAESSPFEETPSFEQAIIELQEIVDELEDNSIGLEASLARFERGIGLLRNCHTFLDRAEQKIEILVGMKANGEPVTEPFDATPTANPPEPKTLF